jgi:hypothetical protein
MFIFPASFVPIFTYSWILIFTYLRFIILCEFLMWVLSFARGLKNVSNLLWTETWYV